MLLLLVAHGAKDGLSKRRDGKTGRYREPISLGVVPGVPQLSTWIESDWHKYKPWQ